MNQAADRMMGEDRIIKVETAEDVTGLTAKAQALDQTIEHGTDRPRPEWVRGVCPQCGEVTIANFYYVGGRGYLYVLECWASLGTKPSCAYRKVL